MCFLTGSDRRRNRRDVEGVRADWAMMREPRPIMVTMGLALVLKPSFRSTSIPGMYWPVSVNHRLQSISRLAAGGEPKDRRTEGVVTSKAHSLHLVDNLYISIILDVWILHLR
jgi:hypothetical protein